MYDFKIAAADPATLYRDLASALEGLIAGEPDPIANMANAAALIWESLPDLNWAGFYRNLGGELRAGAVPGPPRLHPHHVRLRRLRHRRLHAPAATGRGRQRLPRPHRLRLRVRQRTRGADRPRGQLLAVLDLDSPHTGRFTEEDEAGCVRLAEILARVLRDASSTGSAAPEDER